LSGGRSSTVFGERAAARGEDEEEDGLDAACGRDVSVNSRGESLMAARLNREVRAGAALFTPRFAVRRDTGEWNSIYARRTGEGWR
jgi:hypothetical protein